MSIGFLVFNNEWDAPSYAIMFFYEEERANAYADRLNKEGQDNHKLIQEFYKAEKEAHPPQLFVPPIMPKPQKEKFSFPEDFEIANSHYEKYKAGRLKIIQQNEKNEKKKPETRDEVALRVSDGKYSYEALMQLNTDSGYEVGEVPIGDK